MVSETADYSRALEPQQTTKADSDYRPVDIPHQNCHTCTYMIPHAESKSTCQLVEGTVDPQHVCDLWEKEEGH